MGAERHPTPARVEAAGRVRHATGGWEGAEVSTTEVGKVAAVRHLEHLQMLQKAADSCQRFSKVSALVYLLS